MSEAVRIRLTHALLSMLLAAGILLPLLGIMDPSFLSPTVLLWCAGIVLLFELASIKRIASIAVACAALIALAFWLFALDGLLVISDVVLAVGLRFTGVTTALPLVASSAVILTVVLVTLAACFACLRNASFLPAFLLCFSMILLIYLSGSGEMVPWFLPALLALLIILMTDRFPETPVLPLLPFGALLVAGAFLLTSGSIGANPLRDKADELRQAVLDRLFFTEPRDVFSLSSEGFYPEGQDQLGGKPDPDETPVMQVSAPRTVYLRGVILNEYTGRVWRNTTGGRRYLRQSPRLSGKRSLLFDEELPARTVRNALCDPVTVSVRMLSDSASTLFVPQRIRELTPGGELVPYFSDSSELFVTRNLRAGDTYTVSAPLFLAGDSGLGTLIEVCSTLDDSRYEQIVETYTSLPDHLEEPVYAMAREASSVASSPYDKALALQSWLSRTYRYTLDVDPQPSNLDFVTHFLMDTKEGYCTYFASAMTVLCRMIGLPARYVEGYIAEPNENGEAIVTGLSAHAWTEVYFKGFGWLTFDATPKHGGGSQSGAGQEPEPSPTPTPTPSPEPEPEPTPSRDPEPSEEEPTPEDSTSDETPSPSPEPEEKPTPETTPEESPVPSEDPDDTLPSPPPDRASSPPESQDPPGSFPWLWLLLLLLLLTAALRILFTSPASRARRAKDPEAVFNVWTQEITELLHAENLNRAGSESPMAFGRRVDRNALFSVSMGPVGECVSLIRYSRAEVNETDIGLVRDTSILLKDELSKPARLRYLFRRFFIPLKKRDSL
ncbi:MAG: transglutaminase domain-containing protein [Clostridia bacterium]|nr:transglutaminase domain-containing protein [Clostridia bacterium]